MTPEQKTEAKEMFELGASAGVIALKFGVSRNTVCGHLARKGVHRDGLPTTHLHMGAPKRGERPIVIAEPRSARADRHQEFGPWRGVAIWDLRPSHCRWICYDARAVYTRQYCGAPKHEDSAYCETHFLMSVRVATLS